MSDHRRLHPAAIIFNFIKTLRESLFLIIITFISFKDDYLGWYLLGVGVILILIIVFSILSWYRYTYRIEDNELRIEYGIFIRKKRYISKNRIQSIDLTAGVLHRIFKLVKVEIETASSGSGAEASLKAVSLKDGEALRNELKNVKQVDDSAGENLEEELQNEIPVISQKITVKRLFLAGTTSGSIGVIAAIAAVGFSELEQFIPDDFYDETLELIVSLSIVILIVLGIMGLLILWVLGIAGTMIKYGNFTISRNEEELLITRGLLEKKQLTIPLKRIQAIGVEESIIRQPFGYVSVFAEVAGGSIDKGEELSTVLFPIMKANEVEDFLQKFLPEFITERQELNKLPKRSKKYYLVRSVLPFIVMLAGVGFFIPQFIWIPIVLLIGSMYLGILRQKDAGYRIDDKLLTIRYRMLSKVTMVMHHKRIQSFNRKQHKLHKKEKLATIRLSIIGIMGAGKHFTLKELDEEDSNSVSSWYSYRE
ncbi:PH domain-containing protein [Ornithinibacillus halophilus]|nr:PH domain-containing protein [Ornithinibacillus halophilus]